MCGQIRVMHWAPLLKNLGMQKNVDFEKADG